MEGEREKLSFMSISKEKKKEKREKEKKKEKKKEKRKLESFFLFTLVESNWKKVTKESIWLSKTSPTT